MTRIIVAIALVFTGVGPLLAAETYLFGGSYSCAKWMAFGSPAREASEQWILGFWSGINLAKGAMVGRHTDQDGLIGEVRVVCARQPSDTLVSAVNEAYRAVQARGN